MTESQPQVTTVELFFDLVFVFTLTRLTGLLEHEFTAVGLAKLLILLAVLWFMYGGYAWLTNAVPPTRPRTQLLVLVAMAAFFLVSLAIPAAFGVTGLLFAIAYLVVVAIHGALYVTTEHAASRRAVLRVIPANVLNALLVVAATLVHGPLHWVLWAVAAVSLWGLAAVTVSPGFRVRPGHFVERHGLVLLIAFGESLAAVGIGAAQRPLTGAVAVAGLSMVVLLASLWWSHFRLGGASIERAMDAADGLATVRIALYGYGICFFVMLAGLLLTASGAAVTVSEPDRPLPWPAALALGGGMLVYLVGDRVLRAMAGQRVPPSTVAAAALCAATVPLGHAFSGVPQLVALAVVLAAATLAEQFTKPGPARLPRPAGP